MADAGLYGPWYSRREVAEIFHVSIETVDEWRKQRKLGGARLGYRTVRIPQSEIDRLTAAIQKGEIHVKGNPRLDPATSPRALDERLRAALLAGGFKEGDLESGVDADFIVFDECDV